MFFRLAPHGASTLVRLPAASSHRLRSTSIIATIHDAIPPSSSENPTVCAKPRRLDQQGDVHCIVDRLLQSTGALREQTCSWGSAGYGYFIQGCLAHASVQLATSALVSCRAWDVERPLRVFADDSQSEVRDGLAALCLRDLVSCVADAPGQHSDWILTPQGFAGVSTFVQLRNPKPIFAVTHSLVDMARFELVSHLEERGWHWSVLPPPRKRIPYKPGGPKVFHTRPDLEVNRLYLLALAHADQLQPHEVPHGALVQAYMDMLVTAGVIQPKGRRKRRACEELGDIGLEDDNGDLMLPVRTPAAKFLQPCLTTPLAMILLTRLAILAMSATLQNQVLLTHSLSFRQACPAQSQSLRMRPLCQRSPKETTPAVVLLPMLLLRPSMRLREMPLGTTGLLILTGGLSSSCSHSAAYHLSVFSAFAPSTQKPAGPGAQKREHCPLLSFQKNTLASSWL